MDLYSDEEAGVITHDHPAFDGFDTTQVDAMIKKVGGNDADAALRLQAVVKLLESAKTSVKVIEVCVLCFVIVVSYNLFDDLSTVLLFNMFCTLIIHLLYIIFDIKHTQTQHDIISNIYWLNMKYNNTNQ